MCSVLIKNFYDMTWFVLNSVVYISVTAAIKTLIPLSNNVHFTGNLIFSHKKGAERTELSDFMYLFK